jgi:hypothetical protein
LYKNPKGGIVVKRKTPIGRMSNYRVISMDGRRYYVKKPTEKPSEYLLKSRGVIVHFDFFEHHNWLEKLAEKYSKEKSLQHPVTVPVSALVVNLGEGYYIIAEILHEADWPNDVYLVNCFNTQNKNCEMQVMCDVSGRKAKYMRVEEALENQRKPMRRVDVLQEETTAAIVAIMMLGVKVYLNLTKFEVFDELTETSGPYEMTIKPLSVFGYRDYLMMER